MAGGPVGTDPAGTFLDLVAGSVGCRRAQELRPRRPGVALPTPEFLVRRAQISVAHRRSPAVGDQAVPAEDRVIGRDRDDVGAEHRIERRRVDQRGEDLQSVPARARIRLRQSGRDAHLAPPQTVRRAASKAGSWTSTCP